MIEVRCPRVAEAEEGHYISLAALEHETMIRDCVLLFVSWGFGQYWSLSMSVGLEFGRGRSCKLSYLPGCQTPYAIAADDDSNRSTYRLKVTVTLIRGRRML